MGILKCGGDVFENEVRPHGRLKHLTVARGQYCDGGWESWTGRSFNGWCVPAFLSRVDSMPPLMTQ